MRLDLIYYFLAIFVLPSIARTHHHQGISHKLMAFGDKVSAIITPGNRRTNFLDTDRLCRE